MTELPCPEPPLTDGVVLVRAWRRDDLEFVVRSCRDPEVSRLSPAIPFPYTETDALDWFASQEPERLSGRGIDLAITDAASGSPLGAIGLGAVSRAQGSATIGYWLAREARGQGHMSRAVRLVAGWAFDDLGLARLESAVGDQRISCAR